jgi:hypothetical protein
VFSRDRFKRLAEGVLKDAPAGSLRAAATFAC